MISKNELKFIRSLKNKKYRTSERRFLVEGEKNVLELLNSDYEIEHILATSVFAESHGGALRDQNVNVISPGALSDISSLKTNDKVLAVGIQKEHKEIREEKVIFVLDGINDPGNLGTIIRTLDWFGYDQVVCSMDTVECYNPKVISASMGSFTRVRVVYRDVSEFLDSASGKTVVGADMAGTAINSWEPKTDCLVIMGSESHGIRDHLRAHIDQFVSVPKKGLAESLNVGVATGIFCAHLSLYA